jgi:ariadne-2
MSGQGESDMDYSDEETGFGDYYDEADTCDLEQVDVSKSDPEYFEYECLLVEEVERLLNESVEEISNSLKVCQLRKPTCSNHAALLKVIL